MHSARCRRPTQPPLKFTRRAAWIHAASGSTVGTPAASEAIDFSSGSRVHLHTSSVSGWAGGGPVSFEPTRSCGAHRTCSMPAAPRPNPSSAPAFPSRGIFLSKEGRLGKRTGVPQREERVVRERALQTVRRREVPAREAKQGYEVKKTPMERGEEEGGDEGARGSRSRQRGASCRAAARGACGARTAAWRRRPDRCTARRPSRSTSRPSPRRTAPTPHRSGLAPQAPVQSQRSFVR